MGQLAGNVGSTGHFQATEMTGNDTLRVHAVAAAIASVALAVATIVSFASEELQHAARPPTVPVPFQAGERLECTVRWSTFLEAATVELRVAERRNLYGRDAWHFQAVAHTVDPVRLLYALDDQFDSYSDAATLAGLQYEMYIRERDKKEETVVRMSTESEPAHSDHPTVRVRPGTRDPLGFLYFLRLVDWSRVREVRVPVYDGKKLYDVLARQEVERGQVSVPAGRFSALRLELRPYDRGREVTQARFWVWIAQDAARTPVLIEAEVPFGTVRVELKRAAKSPY